MTTENWVKIAKGNRPKNAIRNTQKIKASFIVAKN